MFKTIGTPQAVLARFKPDPSPGPYDLNAPSHNWFDPDAAKAVAAGNPDQMFFYSYFGGLGASTQLATLPLVGYPASLVGKSNVPASYDPITGHGVDTLGHVSAYPELWVPLNPLQPPSYIANAISPFPVPQVWQDDGTPSPATLDTIQAAVDAIRAKLGA
jgi:hypothetical protein